jgi:hypothetical protein
MAPIKEVVMKKANIEGVPSSSTRNEARMLERTLAIHRHWLATPKAMSTHVSWV